MTQRCKPLTASRSHLCAIAKLQGISESIGGEHTYEDVITVGRYPSHHHVVRVFDTEAAFVRDDKGPRLHTSRRETAKADPVDAAPLPAGKGDVVAWIWPIDYRRQRPGTCGRP